MIEIRKPDEIYQAYGRIKHGTFNGHWHFSFGENYDPNNIHFGTLRVFNDDTLSPGAIWPLHHHTKNEVVTYCAEGTFKHADENGEGGILKKGWVQHTTIGTGMEHSEINNNPDKPMRFIQMWFFPEKLGLTPSVEQMEVEKIDRTNKFLKLVSKHDKSVLPIRSDANVYSSFLEKEQNITFQIQDKWGVYLYILEGGPVHLNNHNLEQLSAAKIKNENKINLHSESDTEILLIETYLQADYISKY
ncbi:MAG: pirin family protein [Candidatus Lokiarchaeota archaeon]|nr:pirin family protein [Candidatus Lokiarchaeota archaeon]MBD3200417.1 pirin family protein [Candidatus Lokiarchaeota archaeon]